MTGLPDIVSDLAHYIQVRKVSKHRRYHLLIVCSLERTSRGYLALAHLTKENYFSTILTIGYDNALELALQDLGLRPPQYKILLVGQDANEHIVDALEEQDSSISIVTLGQHYLQEQFSEGDQVAMHLTPEVQAALQRYLNQEIIIVGSIEHEHEVLSAFLPQAENNIYCVLPSGVSLSESMIDSLGEQGKRPIFIPAPYNTFDTFFTALASILIPDRHTGWKVPIADTRTPDQMQDIQVHARNESTSTSKKIKADVLLVTATSVETEAVLACVPKKSKVSILNRAYHDLDLIGGARIVLVQLPHIGTVGSGGSLKTIETAIEALSPWAVIMVGIAFGFDPANQRIGDILISEQIQDYDPERVGSGSGKYPRGNRVRASAQLLSSFIAHQYYLSENWPNPPKIYQGLILSGSKLVDDEDFRNHLLAIAPEAIGGEMEGVGLYEAASSKHTDWLLVKAISDWADGKKHVNKKEYQRLAAENAARFTINVLKDGGFIRPSRR
jgi:nucleoside phosphorylase